MNENECPTCGTPKVVGCRCPAVPEKTLEKSLIEKLQGELQAALDRELRLTDERVAVAEVKAELDQVQRQLAVARAALAAIVGEAASLDEAVEVAERALITLAVPPGPPPSQPGAGPA